jgi:hypothetical protein
VFSPSSLQVAGSGVAVTGQDFTATPSTETGSQCSPDGWCWENPRPQGNQLRAVWSVSATDVWAVGEGGTIQHWNGLVWSRVASGTTRTLYGVWGSSPGDVWVVGASGTFLHWNGSAWSSVLITNYPYLFGVWGSSATDLWAVGSEKVGSGPSAFYQAILLHGDGSSWERVASPTDGTQSQLNAVWGSATDDVWAVGVDVATNANLILHWNGLAWSRVPSGAMHRLEAVWGSSATDVWAAGDSTTVHWDGASWSTEPSGAPYRVRGIWGASANEVWAVGVDASGWGAILYY